ncbi:MAG: DUF6427 family protein [Bacteroidales bacterium]|nr:DUF6427 family protein [Bacteroidales bacterium]
MLIRFFNKSYLPQYISLAILTVLLLLPGLWFEQKYAPDELIRIEPGWQLLRNLLRNDPNIYFILHVILVLSSGIFLNYTLEKFELIIKNTLVPALLYVLFCSHNPELLILQTGNVTSVLLIIVLYLLFDIYLREEAYDKVFYSGFFIAIASFFDYTSSLLLVFVLVSFIVFRLYKWREWLILFFGFITPIFLVSVYYFLTDQVDKIRFFWEAFNSEPGLINIFSTYGFTDYFILAIILGLFLIAAFKLILTLNDKLISIRKRYWSVFWLLIVSFAIFIFEIFNGSNNFGVLIIGICIVTSYFIYTLKKTIWMELTMLILVLSILFNNYYSLFLASL